MTLLLLTLWLLSMIGLVLALAYRCPDEETYLEGWANARGEGYREGYIDGQRETMEEQP